MSNRTRAHKFLSWAMASISLYILDLGLSMDTVFKKNATNFYRLDYLSIHFSRIFHFWARAPTPLELLLISITNENGCNPVKKHKFVGYRQ